MTKNKIATLLLVSICCAVTSIAAQSYDERIYIDTPRIEIEGGSLLIDFNIALQEYQLPSAYEMILHPVITGENGNFTTLPPVRVEGARRSKLNHRLMSLGKGDNQVTYNQTVKVKRSPVNRTIPYHVIVPYETWMGNATVYVWVDKCGCGVSSIRVDRLFVDKLPANRVAEVLPPVKKPAPVKIIEKEVSESVTVLFALNNAVIDGKFEHNEDVLKGISVQVKQAKALPDSKPIHVTVHAYASPEGLYHRNMTLSAQRAEAVKQYFIHKCNLTPEAIETKVEGENWDGLTQLVEKDLSTPNREEALRIIRNVDISKGRESALMRLNGGRTYRYMLEHHFPVLRRADITITYTIQSLL